MRIESSVASHSHGMDIQTHPPQITRVAAAGLVAAPLVAVVARCLATPWLDEPADYLAEVARQPTRSDMGALLMLVSALLLIPAVETLGGLATRRRRTALVGRWLFVAGAVGLAAIAAMRLVAGQMVRLDDRDAMPDLWDRIIAAGPMQVFPMLSLAGAAGSVALGVGLDRATRVPRPAAVLVGIGGAATMLTAAGPVRAAVVAASTIALVAFTWIAVTARRPHDILTTATPGVAGRPTRALRTSR